MAILYTLMSWNFRWGKVSLQKKWSVFIRFLKKDRTLIDIKLQSSNQKIEAPSCKFAHTKIIMKLRVFTCFSWIFLLGKEILKVFLTQNFQFSILQFSSAIYFRYIYAKKCFKKLPWSFIQLFIEGEKFKLKHYSTSL